MLAEGSGEEHASGLIQVVGRIQVLVVAGLKSPFPFWLSVGVALSLWWLFLYPGTWLPASSKPETGQSFLGTESF